MVFHVLHNGEALGTGLNLSDFDTEIGLGLPEVAKTVDKMYQMQKQSAMMARSQLTYSENWPLNLLS